MNSDLSPEFVERCQILLQQDPKSRIFAPLAEAYRRMNMLSLAEQVANEGIKHHPQFASGRVVMAKICIDQKKLDEAVDHLRVASDLSTENILAHRLLAQTLMELKKPREALKAFKLVLFLNPNDSQAKRSVQKLESLTADDYEDEAFEIKPLERVSKILEDRDQISQPYTLELETSRSQIPVAKFQRTLERALSLADAFVVRNDFEKSLETIEEAERQLGQHPELTKRRRFLTSRNVGYNLKSEEAETLSPLKRANEDVHKTQIERLKQMLRRVNDRRVE